MYFIDMQVAKHTILPLRSPEQTANEMRRLVETYADDIGDKKDWTLSKFFDYVKNLPYRADPNGHEMISRPKYSMDLNHPWRDCDDKSILLGSYLYQNGIPFSFRASSKMPSRVLHHVFPVARVANRDLVLDATYPSNTLGKPQSGITYSKNLTGEIMNNSTLNILEGDPVSDSDIEEILDRIAERSNLEPNPYIDDEQASALLGFSFRKLRRRLKKVATPKNLIAASIPGGLATMHTARLAKRGYKSKAGRKLRRRLKKAATPKNLIAASIPGGLATLHTARFAKRRARRLHGEEETLGWGIPKSLKRKAKKLAKKGLKKAYKSAALKNAIASAIPGGTAALAAARSGYKMAKGAGVKMPRGSKKTRKVVKSPSMTHSPMQVRAGFDIKKYAVPAGIGVGVLALALILRGKK